MTGIIITLEKEEMAELVQLAIESALTKLGLQKNMEELPERNDIMTAEEVCTILNLKKSALYQKTHRKEIPFRKQGKMLYFSRQEIYDWLAEGKRLTITEQERIHDMELIEANKKRLHNL